MPVPIQRRQEKAAAKQLLQTGSMSPLGFTAAYLGIFIALQALSALLASSVFVSVITSLFSMILAAGMVLFCMGLRQRRRMPFSTLFDGFAFAGRLICVQLLQGLLLTLIALGGMMLLSLLVSVVGLQVYGDSFSTMLQALLQQLQTAETVTPELMPVLLASLGLTLLASLPTVAAAYRYRFSVYNLCGNPSLGAMDCIRMSKLQTAGCRWRLFCLDLSFLGWACLSLLTAGVLLIWVLPYYRITDLGYYERCCEASGLRPRPPENTGSAGTDRGV